jgi:hypothetical protein
MYLSVLRAGKHRLAPRQHLSSLVIHQSISSSTLGRRLLVAFGSQAILQRSWLAPKTWWPSERHSKCLHPSAWVPTSWFSLWRPCSRRPHLEGRTSRLSSGATRSSDAASSWRSGWIAASGSGVASLGIKQDLEGMSLFFPFYHQGGADHLRGGRNIEKERFPIGWPDQNRGLYNEFLDPVERLLSLRCPHKLWQNLLNNMAHMHPSLSQRPQTAMHVYHRT